MSGPVALVTGSTRGIGLASAKALAAEGFAVALNGPEDDAELKSAEAEVAGVGGTVVRAAFDVADLDAHDAALRAIEAELGPLTTLVNNAGVGAMHRGDPLDVTPESWDRCQAVNARGPFFLTQAFVKRLLSGPGDTGHFNAVINVTSSNAVAASVNRAEYCASKAAASMASKVWSVRLGADGVAVYDVQPGLIETDLTAPVIEDYKTRAKDGLTLVPRVGQPEEVGRVVATLATGQLPYTTGQTVSVDGGMLVPRF